MELNVNMIYIKMSDNLSKESFKKRVSKAHFFKKNISEDNDDESTLNGKKHYTYIKTSYNQLTTYYIL